MKFAAEIFGVGLFAFVALMGAAFAADDLFQQHMWVLFFTLVVFATLAPPLIRPSGTFSP